MKKSFDIPLGQTALDLSGKTRSNIFPWRGQFSPELIEHIFDAYCDRGSKILDPFCGSGTVLCEAGLYGLEAVGVELNPSAYILSKTYELINLNPNKISDTLDSFVEKCKSAFPEPEIMNVDCGPAIDVDEFEETIANIRQRLTKEEEILLDTFVILLDIHNNEINPINIHLALSKVSNAVSKFPYSSKKILALLGDSRAIPIDDESIDLIITSPPYINVFNYHQNYRRSAESLGWDLLKIAKSEIGSNRANRGNRFLTVIQYCLDISSTLMELHRVTHPDGKMIFVVGHESNVLGVPFYNAEIISMIATESRLFELVLRQDRRFKNKFGKIIREDLLHLKRLPKIEQTQNIEDVARSIAYKVLKQGMDVVIEKNRELLEKAISSCDKLDGIPLYNGAIQYNRNHSTALLVGA